MPTLEPPPSMNRATESVELGPLFLALRATNPFLDNRVSGPAPREQDAGSIHETAFQQLCALAHAARAEQRGVGVLLAGEAGIGKSHLLARLGRWAEADNHACHVYLHNLQASPENLPRSLLRSVLSQLTLGRVRDFVYTPLFRLVLGFVSEAVGRDLSRKYSWTILDRAFHELLDRQAVQDAARAFPVDRAVYEVCLRFFYSAYQEHIGNPEATAALAVQWLAGDALTLAEARQLGVPVQAGAAAAVLADNQQVKQVLATLARLAFSNGQPFVLCFDQVDNLDPEQVGALTRFLEALLDSAANLLVVTAGVKATLLDFRQAKVIQDSAWDRVAQVELSLQRITPAEARQLVRVRLDPFFQALADMPALQERREREPLFPLGEDWAEEFLGNKIEVRPRDVLSWAREGWRRLQRREDADGATGSVERNGGTRAPSSAPTPQTIQLAIDQRVEEQVRAHREQRLQRRDTLPPDPENLSGLLAALIQQCQQADLGYGLEGLQRVVSGQLTRTKPYGLIVLHRCDSTQGTLRTGLVFLSTTSALATTAALRCLLQDRRPPHRVLVITDERQPLKFGRQQYAQGRAYFEELRQRGPERFQVVELSFAQYATLDALRAVTGMARSGELEAELSGGQVRPITEVEVRASHHRQGRYLAADLLRLILAPGMNQGGKRT